MFYVDSYASALSSVGYEIEGLENIPERGPALLVYYHGALPIDMYYVIAKLLLYKGRLLHPVGDRFLFYIPGIAQSFITFYHIYIYVC